MSVGFITRQIGLSFNDGRVCRPYRLAIQYSTSKGHTHNFGQKRHVARNP